MAKPKATQLELIQMLKEYIRQRAEYLNNRKTLKEIASKTGYSMAHVTYLLKKIKTT